MNKYLLVSAIAMSTAAVLVWQGREAAAVTRQISALNSQREQVTQATAELSAALSKRTAELAECEHQKNLLEHAAATSPGTLTPWPAGTSANSSLTTRPSEYYWSDANDTVWVPKGCLSQLSVRVLSLDTNNAWRVTDHAAAALVLSETEQADLNRALADALQRYEELARAHFSQEIGPTPEQESKGIWRAKYEVGAFREEAAAVRKQFAESVRDILKGEKTKLFLDFMGQRADSPFRAFGEKEMSILFEWTRTPDDQWALQITETGVNNARPVKCGQTTTRQVEQSNIPPYWRPFIEPH